MIIKRFTAKDIRKATMVLCLTVATTAVSGCAILSKPQASPRVPAPVTEDGMTLDWGSEVKTEALSLIRSSHRYCYLDIYELSDRDVLDALAAAKRRRVDVRVVLDATESHSQSVGVPTLEKDGVPTLSLHIAQGISHLKMLVADGRVLIGGMNFGSGSWLNNDASVYLTRANPSFVSLFRWDWTRADGIPSAPPAYEPPLLDDRWNEEKVVQSIQSASRSISMEAFDLSDDAVVNALDGAVRRGVVVKLLLDPGQTYSREPARELADDGATVRYYTPYQGEWMHAKILDIDGGRIFIIGSANFSHQAYTYNHEADILLRNVPRFDAALQDNLVVQMSRGTTSPGPSSYSNY